MKIVKKFTLNFGEKSYANFSEFVGKNFIKKLNLNSVNL